MITKLNWKKWKINMSHSDEELMSRYCNGEEEAFEILYHRYEKPILSFIYRLVAFSFYISAWFEWFAV